MWADGEKEIGRFGEYNRTDVSLTQVPLHVQDAVLAAEDRSFYSHKGHHYAAVCKISVSYSRQKYYQKSKRISFSHKA